MVAATVTRPASAAGIDRASRSFASFCHLSTTSNSGAEKPSAAHGCVNGSWTTCSRWSVASKRRASSRPYRRAASEHSLKSEGTRIVLRLIMVITSMPNSPSCRCDARGADANADVGDDGARRQDHHRIQVHLADLRALVQQLRRPDEQ